MTVCRKGAVRLRQWTCWSSDRQVAAQLPHAAVWAARLAACDGPSGSGDADHANLLRAVPGRGALGTFGDDSRAGGRPLAGRAG